MHLTTSAFSLCSCLYNAPISYARLFQKSILALTKIKVNFIIFSSYFLAFFSHIYSLPPSGQITYKSFDPKGGKPVNKRISPASYIYLLEIYNINPLHQKFFFFFDILGEAGCRYDREPLLHILSCSVTLCAELF